MSAFEGLKRLHLIMGLQCNVRCTMCYQTDFSARSNMPAELWRDRLKAAYPFVRSVKLQGGEPTVMKNCREAAALLRGYPNAKLEIISNGIFLDDFWHETVVEQGSVYSVSIHGAEAAVYDSIVLLGNHAKVLQNVERVLKHRRGGTPKVLMTAVILKENREHLADLIELGGRLGVDEVEFTCDPILSFHPASPRDRLRAEADRCEAAAARFPQLEVTGLAPLYRHAGRSAAGTGQLAQGMCRAPFGNLVVDWNGDVRVCCNTWVKAGNLYQQDLETLWTGPAFEAFRRKMHANDYSWCSPDCGDNANPTRLSLANKYLYELRTDHRHFFRKVRQKLHQATGTWADKVRPGARAAKNPPLPPVLK